MTVHGISWAGQPFVIRRCDQSMSRVAWDQPEIEPGEVQRYVTDDGWNYTFDDAGVTCEACASKAVDACAKP